MQRNYISLVGGVVLAIVALVLINLYIRNYVNTRAPIALTTVVVAAADLPFGKPLADEQLRVVAWPAASVPKGAFALKADIFKGAKSANDRVVLTPMVAGEPVLRSKISGFGARPIMSARVADGMRAISIHIDDVSGVSGFILPGDHVDIMLTRHINNNAQSLETNVIMQDATVLGIDQLSDEKSDKPMVGHTATVEVTPEQAEKLALAQQAGSLSLALRNQFTNGEVAMAKVTENDLAGPRNERRAYEVPSVRVRYGDGAVVNKPIGQ
jgi:pilus assembly protein CpaB